MGEVGHQQARPRSPGTRAPGQVTHQSFVVGFAAPCRDERPRLRVACRGCPASRLEHRLDLGRADLGGRIEGGRTPSRGQQWMEQRTAVFTHEVDCATYMRTATPSRAGEDDQLLRRAGHRDVAVDRSFDAVTERLRVDEDDQVELESLRQLRGQRPKARGLELAKVEVTGAIDAGDPLCLLGEPGVEDRVEVRRWLRARRGCRCCGWRSARWRRGAPNG